ncbi:MAG: hypothetical protein HY721_32400 [Planctomycetes bacterium]|nr:hypothetical protein [Planctomycetota bacterium]
MTERDVLSAFADDLERFRDGELGADEVRARYWKAGLPAQIAKAMPWVEHFVADADLRAKDPGYRRMQEECLRELVLHLRRGTPASELPCISFLRPPRRTRRAGTAISAMLLKRHDFWITVALVLSAAALLAAVAVLHRT